jgi:aspartate aminotransferase
LPLSLHRVSAVQTISGTGANHLAGLFLFKYYGPWKGKSGSEKVIYLSNPTWGGSHTDQPQAALLLTSDIDPVYLLTQTANHKAIFSNIGCTTKDYPYYDPKTIGLDFQGFKKSLTEMPSESVVLLHACAHNPTGVDPTRAQWKEIAEIFEKRGLFAFFDCAYQGFAVSLCLLLPARALFSSRGEPPHLYEYILMIHCVHCIQSGDLDNDAWAVRHFVERKIPLLVCQSYAKNAGLYGERIGCLNVVSRDADEAKRVLSQLSVLQRSEISNPPSFGARIVSCL